MITVSIERRVTSVPQILSVLRQLRTEAMLSKGYVTGFTLVGAEDRSLVTVLLTWETLKDWQEWEASEVRAKLYKQIEPFLVEEPKVEVYRYLSYQREPRKE
jgi:heme-degrading monooxygenase HmoA